MRLERRSFLQLAAAGLALGATRRSALARPLAGERKLLNVFLRGGNDAVNTLIPQHDPEYASLRPTLRIAPGASLDLGIGGAHLHPALAPLADVYAAGELALVHRVGYAGQQGSHFAEQEIWETADPAASPATEGFVARWAAHRLAGIELGAISVSPYLQRMFVGATPLANVPTLAGPGEDPLVAKLLGVAPKGQKSGSGLLSSFHATQTKGAYDQAVRQTGIALASTLALLEELPAWHPPAASFPTTLAELKALGLPAKTWAAQFFCTLRDAVHLLRSSDCRIAGIELEDFDTHSFQGGVEGAHAERLAVLAHGLRAVRHETLGGIWNDLVVVVESEFGRASRENASGGTDHGRAGLMLVQGGRVLGGVWNCDPVTWPVGQTLCSGEGKYLSHVTDFRAVLAEVFARHFGADPADLDVLIPGWSGLTGPEFTPLGLLP
jgi:uncharacterized protein (DUF1501 family)